MAMNMPPHCWKRCKTTSTGKPPLRYLVYSEDWLACSKPAPTTSSAAEIPSTGSSGKKSRKRSKPTVSVPVVMNMTTVKGRPCNQHRRTAPTSVVRRHLIKRNYQLKPLGRSKTIFRIENTTIYCGFTEVRFHNIWWSKFKIWLCSRFQYLKRGKHRRKKFCRL